MRAPTTSSPSVYAHQNIHPIACHKPFCKQCQKSMLNHPHTAVACAHIVSTSNRLTHFVVLSKGAKIDLSFGPIAIYL